MRHDDAAGTFAARRLLWFCGQIHDAIHTTSRRFF
jgi:hypothetical protein